MNMINDGGPAFPIHPGAAMDGQLVRDTQGMTLRDYFAAKAMQGLLAAWGEHDVTEFSEIASDAYRLADAMLAAALAGKGGE